MRTEIFFSGKNLQPNVEKALFNPKQSAANAFTRKFTSKFPSFSQQNANFNTITDNVLLHREHLLQYIFISVSYILIIILNLTSYASNAYNFAPKMRIIFIMYLSLLIYIIVKYKFNS